MNLELKLLQVNMVFQTMAYLGPNSDMIRDVGCDWWGMSKIEDIWATNLIVLDFFLIDFSSLYIAGAMLWYFCNINLLKAISILF